jgi:hypothetical protein
LKLEDARPAIPASAWRSTSAFRVNGAIGVSARSMPKMPM